MAPNARYTTPVARYRTTSPTPESAYTPPRARPLTMNGWKSCQLGIVGYRPSSRAIDPAGSPAAYLMVRSAPRRRPCGTRRSAGRPRRSACSPGLSPSCLVRRDRIVLVVRDVHWVAAVCPELAQHPGVEVRHCFDRCVDALHRVRTLDCPQRVHDDLCLGEAHLAEAADAARYCLAVFLEYGLVEVHRRRVGHVRRGQLGVHEQLVVPLRAERLGEEIGVAGCRASPQLDPVLQAELLRSLKDHQRLRRGEVEDHGAV